MAYTAEWVNRVDHLDWVEIDLNLTDGDVFHRISKNYPNTPAEVDVDFLAAQAAIEIDLQNEVDAYIASRSA